MLCRCSIWDPVPITVFVAWALAPGKLLAIFGASQGRATKAQQRDALNALTLEPGGRMLALSRSDSDTVLAEFTS